MAATWPAAPGAVAAQLLGVLWFVSVTTGPWGAAAIAAAGGEETLKCEDLKLGQYICKDPKINDATQEPVNCTNYTAHVPCFPAPSITCKDFGGNETHFAGNEVGFLKPISCQNVNGYSYEVAVALSLFLGWLGADRFYLGYPALGLLKFCTVGFCGIGSLTDFILISVQIVGPSDGSSYIIDYYGTRLTRLSITNETFRKTVISINIFKKKQIWASLISIEHSQYVDFQIILFLHIPLYGFFITFCWYFLFRCFT